MRNFRTLDIWNNGIKLVVEIYRIAKLLLKEERYGLKSQICRASISIPSNIAEGCSRNSDTEFKRFLEIAIGSAFELETQLQIIKELNLIPESEITAIEESLNQEQKMINGLISKIKSSN